MATWSQAPTGVKSPPYTDDVGVLREYVKTLADITAIIAKDVSFILNGNVDGKNIKANSIEAKYLSVDELSAITANLGHITAGLIEAVDIYGSYIATSHSYPRTEMDVVGNFLAAISTPGTYLAITPLGTGGVPAISLVVGGQLKGFINRSVGGMSIGTFDGEPLNLQPAGPLQIGGMNGTSASYFVSSAPGGPADIQVNFTKGLHTS